MAQYDIVFVRNIDGSGTAFSEFVLGKPAESNMFLTQNPTTGVLSWSKYHFTVSGNNLISNSVSGNFGFGVANPLQKLDVAGDINVPNGMGLRINNTAPTGAFLRANGVRFTTGYIQAGDLPNHGHNQAGGWIYNGNDEIIAEPAVTKVNIGNSSGSAALNIHGISDDPFGEIYICDTSQNTPYPLFLGQNRRSHAYIGIASIYGNKGGDELLIAGLAEDAQTYHKFMYGKYVYDSGQYYKQGLMISFHHYDRFGWATLFGDEQNYSMSDARFTIYNETASQYPALTIIDPNGPAHLTLNVDDNEWAKISTNKAIEIYSESDTIYLTGNVYIDKQLEVANTVILGVGTASIAPLKFTSGTNLTTPQAGAVEWDGTRLYVTNSARQTLAYLKDVGLRASQTTVINATAHLTPTVIVGTDVGTNVIPANTFAVGDELITKISGLFITAANVQPITFRVLLNSTVLITLTGSLPGSAGNPGWTWTGELTFTIKTVGATGKGLLTGALFMESRSLGYSVMIPLTVASEININTTQANTIIVDAQWTNSGNSLKSIHSSVKLERVN